MKPQPHTWTVTRGTRRVIAWAKKPRRTIAGRVGAWMLAVVSLPVILLLLLAAAVVINAVVAVGTLLLVTFAVVFAVIVAPIKPKADREEFRARIAGLRKP